MYQLDFRPEVLAQYGATAAYCEQLEREFLMMLGPWAGLAEEVRTSEPLMQAAGPLESGLLGSGCSYHAFLFWPLFSTVPEETIQALNFSGRLYADYHFLVDHVIDGDMASARRKISLLKASFLLQQCLGILYRYFPASSQFWQAFHSFQAEVIQAVALEKETFDLKPSRVYSRELFERIASGKAAMLKCTLAALATLTGSSLESVERLYELFDELAVVAQLYDDFCDWKQDLEQGHRSYLLHSFLREIGMHDPVEALALDEKVLKRLFFNSNALQDALREAQQRLDTNRNAPEWSSCTYWLQYLEECSHLLSYVQEQIEKMQTRVQKLENFPRTRSPLERAVQFLTSSQQADGAWSDFYLSYMPASESTDWITGYVAVGLQDAHEAPEALELAAAWLRGQRFPDGSWGYHRGVASDADSTSACLSFLASRLPHEEVERSVQALLSFQLEDGGFSTFSSLSVKQVAAFVHMDDVSEFSGWRMSHPCVSGAAALALCHVREHNAQIDCQAALVSALRYLARQQQEDGMWQAYWWEGTMYATALAVQALHRARLLGEAIEEEAIEKAVAALLAAQLPDGGWSANGFSASCPFQTALAASALLEATGPEHRRAIAAAVRRLNSAQLPNGCWHAETPILRVPHPADTHPWDWATRATPSLGTSSRDQHNLFTTTTVLHALQKAKELNML